MITKEQKKQLSSLIYNNQGFNNPVQYNINVSIEHLDNAINTNGIIKSSITYLSNLTNITTPLTYTDLNAAITSLRNALTEYQSHTDLITGKYIGGNYNIYSIMEIGLSSLEEELLDYTENFSVTSFPNYHNLDLNVNMGISKNHPLANLFSSIVYNYEIFNLMGDIIEEAKRLENLYRSNDFKIQVLMLFDEVAKNNLIKNQYSNYMGLCENLKLKINSFVSSDRLAYDNAIRKVSAKAIAETISTLYQIDLTKNLMTKVSNGNIKSILNI